MAESLPFINSTGLINKIFDKIISAQTPERYTHDFQGTVLGYGSGSARPFIALLKRLGFINSDGTPTEIYHQFRNSNYRGSAMAKALKIGYAPLYKANEYAHELTKDKLKNHVIQITGLNKDAGSVGATVNTFEALKSYANFDNSIIEDVVEQEDLNATKKVVVDNTPPIPAAVTSESGRGMNLSYTINLNLPSSKDPEVFNAIFKSLKENLLS